MNRYTAAFDPLMARIEQAGRPNGVGIVDCPEPEEAALALAERLRAPIGALTIEVIDTLAGAFVARLPADDAVLHRLNGQRDALRARGVFLVVVLKIDEQPRFQRLCGDIEAAHACYELLPFVARTDVSVALGRQHLLTDHRERLQKLDLRGFIRREQEDVSWTLQDVFVMPRGCQSGTAVSTTGVAPTPTLDALVSLVEAIIRPGQPHRPPQPVLLLGEPGGGKSFFLRWCALRDGPLFGRDLALAVPLSLAAFAQAPQPRTLWQYALDRLLDRTPLAAHALTAAAEAGQVVFLLDGLDEAEGAQAQARVRLAIGELQAHTPRCLILVTSRPTSARDLWPTLELLPFERDEVRTFLAGWCALYAAEVRGVAHREAGRREGEALAADILAHERLRQLAGNPLMLTILAIVNRRGLRLPDHRVELYQQISEVLVEKWNRLRALEPQQHTHRPLSLADALRILGPVALELVETGHRGDFDARSLARQIERVQAAGKLTHLGSPDELVRLFRDTLGLIVEHAPGRYRFLHSMLAEFFAAHELVRTRTLEAWAEHPQAIAGQSQRHEPFLLALGILSQLRAEDDRVEAVLERIVEWLEGPLPDSEAQCEAGWRLANGLLAEDLQWGVGRLERLHQQLARAWAPGSVQLPWSYTFFAPSSLGAFASVASDPALLRRQNVETKAQATWLAITFYRKAVIEPSCLMRSGLLQDAPKFLKALTYWTFEREIPSGEFDEEGNELLYSREWREMDSSIAEALRSLGFTHIIEHSPRGETTLYPLDTGFELDGISENDFELELVPPPSTVFS